MNMKRTALLILACCFFLVIAILFYRLRQGKRLLEEEKSLTALVRQELKDVRVENGRLLGELYRQKVASLDLLDTQDFLAGDEKSRQRMVYQAFLEEVNAFRTDEQRFRWLEEALNRHEDKAVWKVRVLFPNCREDQIRRLCLFFAGFSYRSIHFITHDSINALKESKSRYRKKFRALGTETGDFLAALLDGPEHRASSERKDSE